LIVPSETRQEPQQPLHGPQAAAAVGAIGGVALETTTRAGFEVALEIVRQVPLRPVVIVPGGPQAHRRHLVPRQRNIELMDGSSSLD
jgi:hypothetical protein